MDAEGIASALKEALERDGAVDPGPILEAWPDENVPESFTDLEDYEGIESRQLASFVWNGGVMSSYLGLRALRLGDVWFIYFVSDDFESMVLDHVQILDAASATATVEAICRAHEYVGFALPDEIELDDLVDRERIVACFDED